MESHSPRQPLEAPEGRPSDSESSLELQFLPTSYLTFCLCNIHMTHGTGTCSVWAIFGRSMDVTTPDVVLPTVQSTCLLNLGLVLVCVPTLRAAGILVTFHPCSTTLVPNLTASSTAQSNSPASTSDDEEEAHLNGHR